MRLLGWKGAALAALGDRPGVLEGALVPLGVRVEGVKLGESTLNRFFMLLVFLSDSFGWLRRSDLVCSLVCLVL